MKKYDIFICLAIICLAIFVHIGRMGLSQQGVVLTTDTENYAGMAAAMAHPKVFSQDFAYSNPEAYGVHVTGITRLVSVLAQGENYGLAYVSLTGIQFFLHTLFFYILGCALLRQRRQAVLFTILMGQMYWIPWGTYWGNGLIDHVPRTTFAAVYALFVVAALRIVHKPRWWPVFMFGMGCMVYVHSISALPAALGFWLGFLGSKARETKWKNHLLWTVACGLCFLLPMIPFALNFLRAGVTLSADDVTFLREVLLVRYNSEFTYYWQGIIDFFISPFGILLLPFAVAGFMVLRRLGTQEEQERAKLFALWALGTAICAFLYLADQEIAHALHRHPLEFDLIRALRFWVFFAMCLAFMAFNTVWRRVQNAQTPVNKNVRHAVLILWFALWLGLFLGGQNDLVRESARWLWNATDTARYAKAYEAELARKEMLEAIMTHTEADALIFDAEGDRAIRYKALRPLAYSLKDTSIYYYAKNVPKLREWFAMQKRIKESPTAYMGLARERGADYIVSRRPQDRESLEDIGTVVWQKGTYLLVKLRQPTLKSK